MSSRRDAKIAQENAEYEAYQLAVAEEAKLNAEAEARQMAALNTAVGVFKQVVKTQLSVSVVEFRTNVAQAKRRAVAEEARLKAEEEAKLKAEVETRRKAEAEARRALEAAEKRIAEEEACRAAAKEEAAKAALLDEMERRAEEAELCRRAAVQTAIIQRQQDKVAAAKEKQAEKRSAVTVKLTHSLWLVLMCIALVCFVVFMLMPVMSEDAHVEKPKNFQDFERASPQDIQNAMNEIKEETRAQEAIKDQKAKILKEENERAAKLEPILQKQKQEYAKKKMAVDAQEKLVKLHAKDTEEVNAHVEQYFREVHNKAEKAKESKIKTAEKTVKTAVLDPNELRVKNAAKEAKAKKDARERVAKEKLAKKTAKTAVLDVNELQAKNAAKAAKVEKAAKQANFKTAADERRQKTQKLLPDGYEGCDLPEHATAEQRAATKEALQKKQEKEEEKANLGLQKTFCWGVSLPLAAVYLPLGVPAVATCAKFAYSH